MRRHAAQPHQQIAARALQEGGQRQPQQVADEPLREQPVGARPQRQQQPAPHEREQPVQYGGAEHAGRQQR
jgi:hypothetical protein